MNGTEGLDRREHGKGRYRHTTDGEKSSGEIKRDDRHQLDRECQQAVENPWSNSNHCCQ